MSIEMEEFLIPSFLNLNLEFFSAQKQMRKFRRNNRQMVGVILPFSESSRNPVTADAIRNV